MELTTGNTAPADVVAVGVDMGGAIVTAPKLTLANLLDTLQAADDALIQLTEEEGKQLVQDLADKVDDYKYVDEKFDAEIERIGNRQKELAAIKSSLAANQARMRAWMALVMKERKFQKLPGDVYQVTLVTKKGLDIKAPAPTPEMYRKYPALIRRSYEWDGKLLKAAIKEDMTKPADEQVLGKYATPTESSHVQFTVRKELKK